MTILCQATVSDGKWKAIDLGAPWCEKEATSTVRLALIQPRYENEGRHVNVWLCPEHLAEYEKLEEWRDD